MTVHATIVAEKSQPDLVEAQLRPLILDLDHVLIRSDLLWETALAFVRAAPWRLFLLAVWFCQGRAALKARLARQTRLDLSGLPINDEVVALAAQEHRNGRRIHLATAADGELARALARRFAFIDRVFASDGRTNLKGIRKARRLREAFPEGFVYAGDGMADLEVWRAASDIVIVEASRRTFQRARAIREPLVVLRRRNRIRAALQLLRPHQWVKNTLLFVPLVLGGAVTNLAADLGTLIAFIALSLLASGTYILNDLVDLQEDRRHWTKRKRPLASGELPIPHGIALAAGIITAGLALGAIAGTSTLIGLAAYLALTLSYSTSLKRIPIVDVLALAALFTLRLAIGVAAADTLFSPWLLTFSMFLFLSLSLAKRHTELVRAAWNGHEDVNSRGYMARDEPVVLALGIAALLSSVLVFVLYLTQEAFVAAHLALPKLLWCFPPGLFLLATRIWLVSGRGELDDDPVVFALKDRTGLAIVAVLSAILVVAYVGRPF
jgi:4-hydroxybenzoate polyprenyltransferase/phosphoserine phosphatase